MRHLSLIEFYGWVDGLDKMEAIARRNLKEHNRETAAQARWKLIDTAMAANNRLHAKELEYLPSIAKWMDKIMGRQAFENYKRALEGLGRATHTSTWALERLQTAIGDMKT